MLKQNAEITVLRSSAMQKNGSRFYRFHNFEALAFYQQTIIVVNP